MNIKMKGPHRGLLDQGDGVQVCVPYECSEQDLGCDVQEPNN